MNIIKFFKSIFSKKQSWTKPVMFSEILLKYLVSKRGGEKIWS